MASRTRSRGPLAAVDAIRDGLPSGYVWTEREAALLDLAARQAGDIELLEADVAEHGVRVASGHLNSTLCELRQGRVALSRLLNQVNIPNEVKPSVSHARKAAQARWAS